MESAADTSRIMRTMKRAAAFLGLDEKYLHLYINWNVLMVNYSDEQHSFSKFQRCEKHGINLTSISMISKLTWRAIKEDYSLDQYEAALNEVKATPRSFTPWQVAIGGGFACGARLAPFDIKELRDLMAYDEMELDMLGDQRTAMFVIISDTDDTFNFVVSILYTQLFNLLCDKADDEHGGRLP